MSEQLTPEWLAEKRRIAEAATPGPWEQDAREPLAVRCRWEEPDKNGCLGYEVALASGFGPQHAEDARYIAAFDPPTVLAMIGEVEKLRRELDDMTRQRDHNGALYERACERAGNLERERQTLAAAIRAKRAVDAHPDDCEECLGKHSPHCDTSMELGRVARQKEAAALALLDGEKGGDGA